MSDEVRFVLLPELKWDYERNYWKEVREVRVRVDNIDSYTDYALKDSQKALTGRLLTKLYIKRLPEERRRDEEPREDEEEKGRLRLMIVDFPPSTMDRLLQTDKLI